VIPGWALVLAFFAAALLLAPVLFGAWLERTVAERRARTEALVARVRGAAAPGEARVDVEKSDVLENRPLGSREP
jgi:hypothetical protein